MSDKLYLPLLLVGSLMVFPALKCPTWADETPSTPKERSFYDYDDEYGHLTDEELRGKAKELMEKLGEPPEGPRDDSDVLRRLRRLSPYVLPVIQEYLETGTIFQRIPSIQMAGTCRSPDKGVLLPAVVANLDFDIENENEFVAEHFLSSTITAIGRFGPEAAPYAGKVAEYVKHRNVVGIGGRAMQALGEIGQPLEIVLPVILEGVQHSHSYMRNHAAEALGSVGEDADDVTVKDKIIPTLKDLLTDEEWDVRSVAAKGLGKIGSRAKPATPDLVARLTDEHEAVRSSSAEALGKIGYSHPRIEQGLLAMVARDAGYPGNASEALTALRKIGLSEKADPTVILKALRYEERWVRDEAGRLLYHLRPSDEYLPKVLDHLLPLLEDEDSFVRGEVADSLAAMGKTRPAIVQAVLPILESDNPTSRRLGVKIFEQIGPADKSALDKIKQMAKNDPDEEIREAASEASEWIDQEVDELVDDDGDVDI